MAKVITARDRMRKKRRGFGGYLFDLIVKTLLCTAIISVDFTLFASAGSYNLFSSSMFGNLEAIYIYAGIGALSFVLMFIASLIRPLENIILSVVIAGFVIALINQFALFDKNSALLLLFEGLFDSNINMILYEYGQWLTLGLVFFVSWFVLSLFGRSFVFYLTLGVCGLLGWLISESYLHPNVKYFYEVAGMPSLKKDDMGKNIIFLSFNDLTSINNLEKMNSGNQKSDSLSKAANNALGFYHSNNFTLFPNALVNKDNDPVENLALSYNPNESDHRNLFSEDVARGGYFDFNVVNHHKPYLKNNALYETLRKEGYKINVIQTKDADTCYVNDRLAVTSCVEKINAPVSLVGEEFSTFDKLVLLLVQWLDSTRIVPSLNSLFKVLEYAGPMVPSEFKAKNADLGKVDSYNAVKVFDKLIDSIDRLSGNQAYFAVIDLPSDNFVYDEFCKIKMVNDWMSSYPVSGSMVMPQNKKEAYAQQISCLYGSLQKFLSQLNAMGQLEDTTIVIQGLNTPLDFAVRDENFYKQIQSRRGVTFAVKNAEGLYAGINYSVCSVPEIINSIFLNKIPCTSYKVLNTSDSNVKTAKQLVKEDEFNTAEIKQAAKLFKEWFKSWSLENDFETGSYSQPMTDKVIGKAEVMDNVIEDIPEEKMESISAVEKIVGDVLENDVVNDVVEKVEPVKEKVTEQVKEVAKTPSKIEKIAKITFDEISAKVDEVVKQRDNAKNTNVIDKINNISKNLPKDINDTFDNIEKKVSDVMKEDKAEVAPDIEESEPEAELLIEPEDELVKDDIVAETKKAIEERDAQKVNDLREQANKLIDNKLKEKISKQNKAMRDVLEAPVANGQNLSPEELKKVYHQKLRNAARNANIQVEIIE